MRRNLLAAALASAALVASPADAQDGPAPLPNGISDAYPFESQFVTVDGVQMHYVEQGTGRPILMVHGNPTWSYLWRNVIPHVAEVGRVIAVDLVGFGKSGKPDIDYTFQDHSRFLDGFIQELGLADDSDLTLVLHDWGTVLGLDYTRRHEDAVRGIALIEPLIAPAFPMETLEDFGPFADTFRAFRDPVQGPEMVIENNMFIEEFLLKGAVTRDLTDAEKAAYREPFTDPATRKPILVWPNELPIAGEPARTVEVANAVAAWMMQSDTPKLLLYARPGVVVPPRAAVWMQETYRNLDAVFVGAGAHYIQEDQPEVIGRNIADWIRRDYQ